MNVGALLRLIRPPNVFTALADGMAGLLVLWGLGLTVPDRACLTLVASACLYLSGIVLNDVFDRDVDARERPSRPIPSGEVPAGLAAVIGFGLMITGVLAAAAIGRSPAIVALALAAAILIYDGGLKHTRLGPLMMGTCRALDVTMAISTGLALDACWPPIAIAGPVVLGLYITGLTYIARDEVDGNTTRRARTGLVFLAALGAAVLVGLVAAHGLPRSGWAWPWVLLALGLAWRNWAPVWNRHDGPSTGRAIGGGIILIPVIDAAIAAVAGCPFWAVGVVALAVPALVLKQFFAPT